MKVRHKGIVAIIVGAVAATSIGVAAITALAGASGAALTVSYEPDPAASGTVALYDAAGNQITGGSINDSPLAAYYVASGTGLSGDIKANVAYATPQDGVATGNWTTVETWTSGQNFPNHTYPGTPGTTNNAVVKAAATDGAFAQHIASFPSASTANPNIYQIRLYTLPGDPNGSTYYSMDIQVTGTTWTQVYPTPPVVTTTPTPSTTPTTPSTTPTTPSTTPTTASTTPTTPSTTPTTPSTTPTTPSTTPTTPSTTPTTPSTTPTTPSTTPAVAGSIAATDGTGNHVSSGETLTRGATIMLTVGGLTPGATYTVVVHSTPVTLGTAVANSAGVASFAMTVPSSLAAGAHTVEFQNSAGVPVSTLAFSVAAAATPAALANTGNDSQLMSGVGLGLVAIGGMLLLAVRSRRRGKHSW